MRYGKVLAALLASTAAGMASGAACAQVRAYVGAGLGSSDVKKFCGTALSCDKTGTAWNLYAGTLFTRHFGFEAGYTSLGRVSSATATTTTRFESSGAQAAVLAQYPMGDLALFARAGGYYAVSKSTTESAAGTSELKVNNGGLTYGLGLQYDVLRNAGVRGEWQRYARVGGGNIGVSVDVDVFTIGGYWKF